MLAGCSDPPPPPQPLQLDEPGLVAAVGKPPVRRYDLDDGHGVQFRQPTEPGFALEFRQGRVNVAWIDFHDDPSHATANAENKALAHRAFVYAAGQSTADKIMDAVATGKPARVAHGSHEFRVMGGGLQTLVTVYR